MMGDTHLPQTGHDAVLLSDRAREEHPRSWRLFPDVAGLHGPRQDPVAAAAASRRSTSRRRPRDAHGGFHESRLQQQRLQHLRLLQPRPADPAGLLRILPTKRRDARWCTWVTDWKPETAGSSARSWGAMCVRSAPRPETGRTPATTVRGETHPKTGDAWIPGLGLCSTFVVRMCSKTKKSCLQVNYKLNVFLWFISK